MKNFFMGGDYWGERVDKRLGQALTYGDVARMLKAAVDMQYNTRQRNDKLPAAYQLDQETDILPVDQALEDKSGIIVHYNQENGSGLFWNQPASKEWINSATTLQGLVKALDARERAQEKKAGETIANPPQAPLATEMPKASSGKQGAILLVVAVAALATGFFISDKDWGGLPWSESHA